MNLKSFIKPLILGLVAAVIYDLVVRKFIVKSSYEDEE